jgi:hypothetical protein
MKNFVSIVDRGGLRAGVAALALLAGSAQLCGANPSLVGEWLAGPASLADVSGYSPPGTHDGYIVGAGNYLFISDVPPGKTGQSLYLFKEALI